MVNGKKKLAVSTHKEIQYLKRHRNNLFLACLYQRRQLHWIIQLELSYKQRLTAEKGDVSSV